MGLIAVTQDYRYTDCVCMFEDIYDVVSCFILLIFCVAGFIWLIDLIFNNNKKRVNFTDEEIQANSTVFGLKTSPTGEKGELTEFKQRQRAMRVCMEWLRDNYKESIEFKIVETDGRK